MRVAPTRAVPICIQRSDPFLFEIACSRDQSQTHHGPEARHGLRFFLGYAGEVTPLWRNCAASNASMSSRR
jgi:hypothetical protein